VLINLYILVPHYYLPNARIAYKASYGHPAIVPDSYQYEDWIISYWYRKKPAGAARVSGT
ncbi:hypothetical protein, partial [Burkholderia cepacia]